MDPKHYCTFQYIQGVSSFLPPPNFFMRQNPEKKQSPEPNGKVPSSSEFRVVASSGLPSFGGGKSWTGLPVQDSVFFGFWHIGKFWGGNLGVARRMRHPVGPTDVSSTTSNKYLLMFDHDHTKHNYL